ncbi:MAG: hypothetical protein ACPGVH_08580 [Chitinophagales bacterium]
MKSTILTTLLTICAAMSIYAQSNFNYQGVLRDDAGEAMANSNITIQFEFREDVEAGAVIYSESHDITTNEFGEFNTILGTGNFISGNFSGLDYKEHSYFINTTINTEDMGTTEIQSVPVAQTALNAYWNKNSSNEIYVEDEGVIIGSNTKHADKLTVEQNVALTGFEIVDFRSEVDLESTQDILNLQTTSSSNDNAQFIECSSGAATKFQVNVSGDIKTYGEIHSENTADANMLAVAYGTIDTDGSIINGSENFYIGKGSSGTYTISISGSATNEYTFIVTPSYYSSWPITNMYIANVSHSAGPATIIIYDVISSAYEDSKFHFVAYKK